MYEGITGKCPEQFYKWVVICFKVNSIMIRKVTVVIMFITQEKYTSFLLSFLSLVPMYGLSTRVPLYKLGPPSLQFRIPERAAN